LHPEVAFTSLNKYITTPWLREAYRLTRKDGAVGVDGQTAAEFEANLAANIEALREEAKSGRYRAFSTRRVHIPKGDGKTRPLGIPTFRDKVLQRQVMMILEPLFEEDFLDCSYGFRPGRSAHDALEALREELMPAGGWVLDVDIQRFFETLDHAHLRTFVEARVRDGVIGRLIGKWLNAGVMEDGATSYPEQGTPQGGVISPLLANVYLHHVLDAWFEREVKPRLAEHAAMVRYADDVVMVFTSRRDAERVMEVLPKRMGRFGLTLHPEKTRLVRFERPRDDEDGDLPDTFNFLGFTHHWCRSRKNYWVIKRKTATDRLRRSLRKVTEWCRRHRHDPIREQHATLSAKVRGHCQYYGVTGNSPSLVQFVRQVERRWRFWLNRRSRQRSMTWERFGRLMRVLPLPPPIAYRSALRT
jgi:group II intron reverse transcriptase/maturase